MRKTVSIILCVLMLVCSLPVSASAENSVSVSVDGSTVAFTEDNGSPFIDANSRTLVPLRVTMESCGCTVLWDNEHNDAVVYKDGVTVVVPIGESRIIVNGEDEAIDSAAVILNGRTYLPIRAVLEAFGSDVGWDGDTSTVTVTLHPVDYSEYNEQTEKLVAALNGNPYLEDDDRQNLIAYIEKFGANIQMRDSVLDRTVKRFSALRIVHGAIPTDSGLYVSEPCGLANTDTDKIIIDDDQAGRNTPYLFDYYILTLTHETTHIISGTTDSSVYFNEGLVDTIAAEATDTYFMNYYEPLRLGLASIMEIIGTEPVLDAYFADDATIAYTALSKYTGRSDTESYVESLFKGMLEGTEAYDSDAYLPYAEKFWELIASAYKTKYGTNAEDNPIMLCYEKCIMTVCGGRYRPSFYDDHPYYFFKDSMRDYVQIRDLDGLYCSDGEYIAYRYELPGVAA